MPTIKSSNPRVNPQTRELVFSDITPNISGQYTCYSVVNIPEAQIDDYIFGTDTVQVNTDSEYLLCICSKTLSILRLVPGKVENLVCAMSSSASELSFSWDPPTLLGSEVVSYQVIVNRLEHRPGTREVIQSGVYDEFVDIREVSVIGLGKFCYKYYIIVHNYHCYTLILQTLRFPIMSQ